MSKYEIDVWEYSDTFKNLDTNETFGGYDVCKLLEQKDAKIADLEAKLAESESCAGMLHHHLTDKQIEIEMLGEEIKDLKQQLAEKDNELNDICQNYDFQINDFSREIHRLKQREKILEQQLAQKEEQIKRLEDFGEQKRKAIVRLQKNKSKINTEFAIQQLERVKEFVVENSYVKVYKNEYGGYNETEPYVEKEDMLKELDKMISEIKGE